LSEISNLVVQGTAVGRFALKVVVAALAVVVVGVVVSVVGIVLVVEVLTAAVLVVAVSVVVDVRENFPALIVILPADQV